MPSPCNRYRCVCLLVTILPLAGCQDESPLTPPPAAVAASSEPDPPAGPPPTRQEVTGVVNMDGHPLAGATIVFSPLESGAAAFGNTDNGGRFRLMFSQNEPGILPGRYQVRITTAGSLFRGSFSSVETVPSIYNEASTLFKDIDRDTTEIMFELQSDADVGWREKRRMRTARGPFVNVVLIVANGLGPEWLGCYGGEAIETPNIDALAASGLKFTNVYSMPERTASRVTLLTGMYPYRHGWVGEWDVPRSGQGCWFDWNQHQTVARRLTDAEITTSIAGQWQLNDFRRQPDALLQHGFLRWCVWTGAEDGNPASRNQHRDPYIYLNRPLSRDTDGWPGRNVRQYDWGGTGTFVGKLGPDVFAQFVSNTVSRRTGFRQFVYYPMTLPAATQIETDDERTSVRYRAMVRYTDKLIGNLIELLDYTNQRAGTVVILTSDGGAPAGIVGRMSGRDIPGGRGTLSERGIRVPLIVSCPGIVTAGVESDCLVDFSDLAPTICELALLRTREDDPAYDGRSFAPVLLGGRQAQPRDWIMSMGVGPLVFDGERVRSREPFAERVLRDHRYKIHVTTDRTIDALYDLAADPAEERNLISSGEPEHVQAIARFRSAVDGFPMQDAELRYSPLPDPLAPRTTAAPARVIEPAS